MHGVKNVANRLKPSSLESPAPARFGYGPPAPCSSCGSQREMRTRDDLEVVASIDFGTDSEGGRKPNRVARARDRGLDVGADS